MRANGVYLVDEGSVRGGGREGWGGVYELRIEVRGSGQTEGGIGEKVSGFRKAEQTKIGVENGRRLREIGEILLGKWA